MEKIVYHYKPSSCFNLAAKNTKLCFDDILLVPEYSTLDSRTTPSLSTKIGNISLSTPIISAPMDSITGKYMLVVMDKLGGLGILTRHIHLPDDEELMLQKQEIKWAKENGAKNVGCAIGIRGQILDKAKELLECGCNVLCIDVAHGDHERVYEAIVDLESLKTKHNFALIAGNICVSRAARTFASLGVDGIKVGIGPGAACTTRLVTGFGYPQLSAVSECARAIEKEFPTTSIIADGGLRTSGDMVKALWGGANACMIGYMLAGTSATPRIDGKKLYRGMSSRAASGRTDIAPEGVEISVGDRGKTEEIVQEYAKGIKSGLAMGGSENIEQLRKIKYVQVSPLSIPETMSK